jgi:outer membrane protein TolC
MRKYWISAFLITFAAAPGAAQTPSAPLKISVDDAVRMALQNNVDLAAARIDPQISDARVAGAVSIFKPTVGSSLSRNNQL